MKIEDIREIVFFFCAVICYLFHSNLIFVYIYMKCKNFVHFFKYKLMSF